MKGIFHSLLLAAAIAPGKTVSLTPVDKSDSLSPQPSVSGDPASINNQESNGVILSSSTKKQSNSSTRPAIPSDKIPTKASISSSASASLRRIKKEYKDAVQMGICYDWVKGRLITSASTKRGGPDCQLICLGPLATNLRHWHFSFRGVKNSLYESGIYHGRILLPKDYPATPPRVQLWTPSGRFQPLVDICLSASAYHPESWTPRWTVLSLVHALRLHMLTNPQEIGGIVTSAEETLEYARRSLTWKVSWVSGNTRLSVDHAKLLEQGVLTICLDEEGGAKESIIAENADGIESSVERNIGVEAVPIVETKNEEVSSPSLVGPAVTSRKEKQPIEAAGTSTKVKSKPPNKCTKKKKTTTTMTLKTSGLDMRRRQSKTRLRAALAGPMTLLFGTPWRAGLFWFFLMFLIIMPR